MKKRREVLYALVLTLVTVPTTNTPNFLFKGLGDGARPMTTNPCIALGRLTKGPERHRWGGGQAAEVPGRRPLEVLRVAAAAPGSPFA